MVIPRKSKHQSGFYKREFWRWQLLSHTFAELSLDQKISRKHFTGIPSFRWSWYPMELLINGEPLVVTAHHQIILDRTRQKQNRSWNISFLSLIGFSRKDEELPSEWLIKVPFEKLIHFRSIVSSIQFYCETSKTELLKIEEEEKENSFCKNRNGSNQSQYWFSLLFRHLLSRPF